VFLTKYKYSDQIKDKMGTAAAHMGEIQNEYKILAGRPEGKRSLERLEY
jgi:hypothetical protein